MPHALWILSWSHGILDLFLLKNLSYLKPLVQRSNSYNLTSLAGKTKTNLLWFVWLEIDKFIEPFVNELFTCCPWLRYFGDFKTNCWDTFELFVKNLC